ncbi:MAG: flagellum-specific ATP synthase FliI, partial [Desulfobacterales bacterium]
METPLRLDKYRQCLDTTCTIQTSGKVTNIVGLVIEAQGPLSRLGTVCDIYTQGDVRKIRAEVLGFRDNKVMMMPLEEMRGIGPG